MTNASYLAWIGYIVLAITAVVCAAVHSLWKMKVDKKALDNASAEAHSDYMERPTLAAYFRWKKIEVRKYPQFWAVALLIAWLSVPSMASMWMYSLHPPCETRGDCQATAKRGIYTGAQDE